MNKLVAIVGPTASGKSQLALKISVRHDSEIICADSRTIYRGMDIGTAKPTNREQAEFRHHLLDVIDPDQTFSAAEFKERALDVIADIYSRGHLPILVGGSGLYAYAVLYNYQFPAGADNKMRQKLQQLSQAKLIEQLQQNDPEAAEAIDLKNPRRVIRAIETAGQPKRQSQLMEGTILVGLKPSEAELSRRITERVDEMLAHGLEDEVRILVNRYGEGLESLRSPGYSEVVQFLKGEVHDFELPDLIDLHTRQLAKRQLTWFKRNPDINWFDSPAEAESYIEAGLKVEKV